jgi:hypothetical protein
MIMVTLRPHDPEGGVREKEKSEAAHQFSSTTVTVDERELSWTFWRMMSRRGLERRRKSGRST